MSGGAGAEQLANMQGQDVGCPLFPILDKESVKENLTAIATAALLGITAIDVLTSTQGQDPTAAGAKHVALRKFMVGMPYAIFPVGLAGLAAAMVASKRRPRLLGFASGILLGELMFLVLMGGLVTTARADVKAEIVWPVTAAILVALVICWPLMCAYPEFLRRPCCCSCYAKVEDDLEANQNVCQDCHAHLINGTNPNPAAAGADPCQRCGGTARNASGAPGEQP
ncbi:unnamed protein product [Urochloa humidicola]